MLATYRFSRYFDSVLLWTALSKSGSIADRSCEMAKKAKEKKQATKATANRDDLRKRELLRITEAASILGESRANVYLRIRRGEVKAIQFGKTLRIHAPSLFALIDKLVAGEAA
jgi:excisionase family DNA binding protein